MLGFYLTLGLGISLALTAGRWDDVKSVPTKSAVLGVLLTIVCWPYAIYNNFNRCNHKE